MATGGYPIKALRWVVSAGVEEDDVVAQTRAGKQVLNVGSEDEAAAVAVVKEEDDYVAVTGTNSRLLLFPMEELPLMARGRGVIMQRYGKGHFALHSPSPLFPLQR